eukprot:scaffold44224_cov61-Phaeocystis_antarctica.AAC.1
MHVILIRVCIRFRVSSKCLAPQGVVDCGRWARLRTREAHPATGPARRRGRRCRAGEGPRRTLEEGAGREPQRTQHQHRVHGRGTHGRG